MGAVEVAEAAEHGFCNLSENVDAYGAELARHPVQSTHVHVLHAHDDVARVVLECAVEVDNVGRVALVHDAQLAHDALAHFVLGFDVYDLPRHDDFCRRVLDLADCASVS